MTEIIVRFDEKGKRQLNSNGKSTKNEMIMEHALGCNVQHVSQPILKRWYFFFRRSEFDMHHFQAKQTDRPIRLSVNAIIPINTVFISHVCELFRVFYVLPEYINIVEHITLRFISRSKIQCQSCTSRMRWAHMLFRNVIFLLPGFFFYCV